MRIVLISCVAKKKEIPALARDLYISPLFKGAYRYARKLDADKIFILSAKYGLLEETDMIEPYNETLNNQSVTEIKKWASNIIDILAKKTDLHEDEFILLAGEKYRKYLIDSLRHTSIPLKGLSIGKQLAFYKENL
ncbi:MAG: hypothetical protein P4L69_22380 [Desulfosporosinus sp.]|nr:hypothetical protein [Desulfosporosinus sp.]